MRLVILTQYYPPEAGAPQTRLHALARGLADAGVAVTVHTCPPHYPDGVVRDGYARGLRPYARNEDGIEVLRSLALPAANRGVGRRLADHASFAAAAVVAGGRIGAADVVLAETPPLFLAAAAPLYARRLGARLVLHVSDLWPDSVVELGAVTSPLAIRAARALERHAYRHAARIVTPTAGIARRLERRPESAGRVTRIPPGVDVDRFAAPPLTRDGPLRVLYAGTVGMAQGLATLVDAARRAGPRTVTVTIAGAGAELDEVRHRARGIANVRVLGAVAPDDIPRLYAESDVAAVLLRDRPLFDDALPTKLFEAMAAGRPILLAARGESAELVRDARAGTVVAPEDAGALAQALVELAVMPESELCAVGARAADCARRFDRGATTDAWLSLLESLSEPRAPSPAPSGIG